jgi:hypothetical protein
MLTNIVALSFYSVCWCTSIHITPYLKHYTNFTLDCSTTSLLSLKKFESNNIKHSQSLHTHSQNNSTGSNINIPPKMHMTDIIHSWPCALLTVCLCLHFMDLTGFLLNAIQLKWQFNILVRVTISENGGMRLKHIVEECTQDERQEKNVAFGWWRHLSTKD